MPPVLAQALKPTGFSALPGWLEDDHREAFQTFRRSCREILEQGAAFQRPISFGGRRDDWLAVCRAAQEDTPAKQFFEKQFIPFLVLDDERPDGLFTGYYEPQVEGSRYRSAKYTVPLYGKPADLAVFDSAQQAKTGLAYGRIVNGRAKPYFTRKEIEEGALAGHGLELVWLKDWADAFFIHVQGSGTVLLEDGSLVRLSYAAKSGHAYTGIGGLLVNAGVFGRDEMSMQSIRAWVDQHPEDARRLMWQNQSFIFFREVELAEPSLGPLGAQHAQLTPGRSLAVDRSIWAFGTPMWLDTKVPSESGLELRSFRHLVIAQDTGSAIKGVSRGDLFWGAGEAAGRSAGPMKSPGTLYVLLPHAVAQSLELHP